MGNLTVDQTYIEIGVDLNVMSLAMPFNLGTGCFVPCDVCIKQKDTTSTTAIRVANNILAQIAGFAYLQELHVISLSDVPILGQVFLATSMIVIYCYERDKINLKKWKGAHG